MKTEALEVSSSIPLGYEHGFKVPIYSNGGDSGAGLFLIEKGDWTADAFNRHDTTARRARRLYFAG